MTTRNWAKDEHAKSLASCPKPYAHTLSVLEFYFRELDKIALPHPAQAAVEKALGACDALDEYEQERTGQLTEA